MEVRRLMATVFTILISSEGSMEVRRLMATVFTILLFYFEICIPLDHFIDIGKGLWRSED
ncbi:hypothetical protein E2C01_077837 [Portunus trituberculatus]|uniref:Uncharacterized protein n=1 Tax=Portunus trituberculatus TaxID=210409 RepID=A0A5B7IH08_PORTR|nr:hypothetical protein [Portunus trituberculatus]